MRKMRKIIALGAAGVLSLAMGTTVFAADSAGRFACATIGHHMNYIGCIDTIVYEKEYCDNYALSGSVRRSVDTCVTGYSQESALADRVVQNSGVCVQGCPGGYVDADNNGICDNCEAAGYHGYCDNFIDADGNGVCDNLHNGDNYGNLNGSGNGNAGANGNGSGNGNAGANGNGNGNGYNYGNGGHHASGHNRGCRH